MAWKKRQGIMLCQPLDERNLERNFQSCPYMLAQPKLDGMRCWVSWQGGEPTLWSSEGNPITGVPHIQLLLKDWAAKCGQLNFDGELYNHSMSFEDIISINKRGSDNLRDDFSDMEYHIFDVKLAGVSNFVRVQAIKNAFLVRPQKVAKAGIFKMVPTSSVSRGSVDAKLEEFISKGYEGIILRNPLAYYVEKRPWTVLKWKPSKHDTYRITQVWEAVSEDGTPLGRVGALTCEDRFGNRFSVGPGLGITHEKAADMWAQRRELVGGFAKVYYQNHTTNGVPRFGKFSLAVAPTKTDDEVHF